MCLHGLFFVFAWKGGEREREQTDDRDRETERGDRGKKTEGETARERECILTEALIPS